VASAAAVSSNGADNSSSSIFPSARDLQDLGQWVFMNSVMFKVTGGLDTRKRMPANTKITGWEEAEASARRLFTRLTAFRAQLRNAWLQVCRDSRNDGMLKLANRMFYCKLVVRKGATAKPLCDEPRCIWSGETEELCELALLPIEGGDTLTLGNRSTPQEMRTAGAGAGGGSITGTMCHVQTRFVDMLKCLHTLFFLLDYVNLDIDTALRKPTLPEMTGPWSPEMDAYWQQCFNPPTSAALGSRRGVKAAANPLAALVKRVKEMLRFNCEVVRSQFPAAVVAQYLVPIAQ
jgi:hypothetical protein